MKRRHRGEDDSANKKQRRNLASDIFDDESLSNCFCNVNSVASATGYFTGSVDMLWPNNAKKFMFNFSSKCCVTEWETHKISVTFEGDWIETVEAKWGPIRIMDQIQLSLDGVTLVQPKGSGRAAKLIYKEGVLFRRTRKADSCFVNSWQLKEEEKEREEKLDWFSTPAQPVIGPLSKFVRSSSDEGPKVVPIQEENTMPPEQTEFQRKPEEQDGDSSVAEQAPFPVRKDSAPKQREVVSVPTSDVPPQPRLILQPPVITGTQSQLTAQGRQPAAPSSGSRRAQKKEKKQLAAAARAAEPPMKHQNLSAPVASPSTIIATPQPQSAVHAPAQTDTGHCVLRLSQLAPNITTGDDPQGWMARLQRFKSDYTMLKDATREGNLVSMIGIIKNFKQPSKTIRNEWSSTVYLQDPSLLEGEDFYSSRDYSVVFFQKRFREWLPQVTKGDILVLHDIRINNRNGIPSGVGYHDKAKWAVFSIKDKCFVPPQIGGAPEDQELVDGGVRITPFLRTAEPEEHYCQQLSGWWKEKYKTTGDSTDQVYHLSEEVFSSGRKRRQHLLLCDAGPDVVPGGYFDCTFEVLNILQTSDQLYTLYVTDYTKNSQVAVCQAQWCPPGLNDYVVKFEIWDAAAQEAQSFTPGTYWGVKNARLKCGSDGYVEGKIVEKKFNKLDPELDYPPLQNLLRRKKEWESQNRSRQNRFAHKLLKDTQDGEYINCTVELLHTTKDSHDETYIEVTDYTTHPKLSSYRYEKEWSRDLEGLIISILLRDVQARHVENLRAGTFLTIRNLRLRDSKIRDRFQGELGGREILIYRLDNKNPNDDLKALLRRKEKWKEMKDMKKLVREPRDLKANLLGLANRPNLTIKEFGAHTKGMLKVRVIARVVAYHPHPTKWIRAWCSQCKQSRYSQRIPDGKRACHSCQDTDHEFVRWKFRLLLRIEDKEGDQMDVLLGDQCGLLRGLERGDCLLCPSIIPDFAKRLEPLLGDASKTCEGTSRELDTDYAALIIARCEGTDFESTCILFDVENQ